MTGDLTGPLPAGRGDNPYVGPTAFRPGDALHGRDQARDELLDLVIAERIVLLYSPSGAGKTSLIQASLVGALEEARFEVLPVIRVTHALSGDSTPPVPCNRYVMGTLLSLEEGVPRELQRPVAELAGLTLSEYLHQRPDLDGRPGNEVLVFDQFEEVLTADPTDEDAKREFFVQLGAMLGERERDWEHEDDREHELWALFSMREDFLAALDPYLRHVPTRFRTRYRLDLLTTDQALDAVRRPAEAAGVPFAPDAAQRLVDDLRRVRVQRPGGTEEVLGPYIEPVQLQVACHLLWSRLPPGTTQIQQADGTALGDVEEALARYYANQVAGAAARAGVREGVVRDWFEQRLITPQGLRGQVLDGPLATPEADSRLLQHLLGAHLVRAESRRQATWYELSHDRFIEPVVRDNAAWRIQHLTEFERAAALWDSEHRTDGLLLVGPSLAQAEQEVSRRPDPLSRRETDFLEASRRAHERQVRERRNAVRIRRLGRGLVVVGAVSLVLLLMATWQFMRVDSAEEQLAVQEQQRDLVLRAQGNLFFDPESSVVLARAATDLDGTDGLDDDVRTVLSTVAGWSPVREVLRGHDGPVVSASLSEDGGTTVTATAGRVYVWDRSSGKLRRSFLPPGGGTVRGVDISADGAAVVVGTLQGRVAVWDISTGSSRQWADESDFVWSIDISGDGRRVAAVAAGETITVWDGDGTVLSRLGDPGTEAYGIAFNADGTLLASASDGTHAVVWDVSTGKERARVPAGAAHTVQFSADGDTLATIGMDNTVRVWDWRDESLQGDPSEDSAAVHRLLSDDLTRVLSTTSTGDVTATDVETGAAVAQIWVPGVSLVAAGLDPVDPSRVLVLPSEGDPAVWQLEPSNQIEWVAGASMERDRVYGGGLDGVVHVADADGSWRATPVIEGQGIRSLAAGPDGSRVVTVTEANEVHLWDVGSGDLVHTLDIADDMPSQASFLPDGRSVVVVTGSGGVTLWDVASGEEVREVHQPVDGPAEANSSPLTSLAVAPDGSCLVLLRSAQPAEPERETVTTAPDSGLAPGAAEGPPPGLVVCLDGETEPVELPLPSEASTVPDARTVLGTGDAAGSAAGGPVVVSAHAFSPDGERFALVTERGTAVVYDSRTWSPLWAEGVDDGSVGAVGFTADGNLLTAGEGGRVQLWDGASGGLLRTLTENQSVQAVAFATDGHRATGYGSFVRPITLALDDEELADILRERSTRALTQDECDTHGLDRC